jgi:hypothetical protein
MFERNENGDLIVATWRKKIGRWLVQERVYKDGAWTPFVRLSFRRNRKEQPWQ